MASPNSQRTKLAIVKDFLAPVFSCCGARKKPVQPIEIHPPKDFRRMEIRFDGLTPEQEAFLREKAFLDTLPPTPPLPILSPSAPGTATPPTPTSTTTNPFFTHSNVSCYFNQPHHHAQKHHHHHDLKHNDIPATHKPTNNNTYSSCSAPHLSTTTTTTTTTGGQQHHHQYTYPPYSVPHLPGAAAQAATANINTSPSRRQLRRFSAINILRGSWNNSHPVSPEEAAMTESSRGSSTHHLSASAAASAASATTPTTPSPQYHRRVRKLRALSGVVGATAAAGGGGGGALSEVDLEDRRRGKWGFVGQGLEWEKGGGGGTGGGFCAGDGEMRGASGGSGGGRGARGGGGRGLCEAKSLESLGRDSEVTLGGSGCGCDSSTKE